MSRIGFGALLRAMRLGRGLSQDNLGIQAALDPPALRRLEAGTSSPKRASVERLALAFEAAPHARARLLARAGYWPWPELDDATLAVVLAAALVIIEQIEAPRSIAAEEAG